MSPKKIATPKRSSAAKAPRSRTRAGRLAPAKTRAPTIYSLLARAYPDARTALHYETAFQLLVATILSAQCTDKRVNMVTPALFAAYPTPESLADADPLALEEMIKSTGFFRSKTKSLIGMATAIVRGFGGVVPADIDALVLLPGVGRKTANVILGNAFGQNVGVVVDTHVGRLSQRLGFTKESDPVKIEHALISLFPRADWTMLAHLLIEHGRRICVARSPKCGECVLNDLCPSSRV